MGNEGKVVEVRGRAYRVKNELFEVGELYYVDVYVDEIFAFRAYAWKCVCGLVLRTLSLKQLHALYTSHMRKHPGLL